MDKTVIRFDRNGHPQTGLQAWDPVPAESIASGSPDQNGHVFYASDDGKVSAGVWDSTPYEEIKRPYAVDEFMILLDGSLDIENEDGSLLTLQAGQGFVIPKGAVVAWRQSHYLRKFFFIHDNGHCKTNSPGLQTIKMDPSAVLPALVQRVSAIDENEPPHVGRLTLYQDPSRRFQTGIWDCSPTKYVATTIERSELMHILEGNGTITNADGVEFHFTAGDTFLVPAGMGYRWQNHEYVRKLFCSYTV